MIEKIAILNIYYGNYPPYFNLWLKSCEYNPTIDFFLITDNNIKSIPKNVYQINLSFTDFKLLSEKKLGLQIKLDRPYKICDLKPMCGVIFEDYLSDYDYWGFCDIDLIFGNLRSFFEKYNLNNYIRFGYLGHLAIYKNNYEGNNLFKLPGSKCGDWKEVLTSPEIRLFDEWPGMYAICKKNNIKIFDKRIFADISIIYSRFRLALDDINYDRQLFYWEKGHVYRMYWKNKSPIKDEFLYIHFKRRKFDKELFNPKYVDSFYIGPNGFTEKNDDVTLSDVEKINPFKGRKFEIIELYNYHLKIILTKIKNKVFRLFK